MYCVDSLCCYNRGGGLFHRIRLLPAPLSDHRLLQLLRQADMVLDTFPVGTSFYFLALALSVGTPVIALRTGTHMHSSKDDLKEMRTFLAQSRQKQRQNNVTMVNPMAQYVAQSDLPFSPSLSAVNGFYRSIGMEEHFIANSTAEYFQLAVNLATNRYLQLLLTAVVATVAAITIVTVAVAMAAVCSLYMYQSLLIYAYPGYTVHLPHLPSQGACIQLESTPVGGGGWPRTEPPPHPPAATQAYYRSQQQ